MPSEDSLGANTTINGANMRQQLHETSVYESIPHFTFVYVRLLCAVDWEFFQCCFLSFLNSVEPLTAPCIIDISLLQDRAHARARHETGRREISGARAHLRRKCLAKATAFVQIVDLESTIMMRVHESIKKSIPVILRAVKSVAQVDW